MERRKIHQPLRKVIDCCNYSYKEELLHFHIMSVASMYISAGMLPHSGGGGGGHSTLLGQLHGCRL